MLSGLAIVLWVNCFARPAAAASGQWGFEQVRGVAAAQAQRPFEAPQHKLPAVLQSLDYDAYQAITYRAGKAIWADSDAPFQIQFFHRGYLYRDRVEVRLVDAGGVTPVAFEPGLFQYGRGQPEGLEGDLGFAGLRVLYPLNKPGHWDEVISFLGASYFRAVGRDGVYGASARGLAIDMGLPDKEEEFPLFRQYWIVRPEPRARCLTIYALLDSPSVAGAYRFDILPGDETVVAVRACLYCRHSSRKIGYSPLTSMFLRGKGDLPSTNAINGKFRPEVHDSDGLLLATAGEWLWRPLRNPVSSSLSSFRADTIRGFGFQQRERDPRRYLDAGSLSERRPSIWVEPSGKWGLGRVELLELATATEWADNIAAQFVPDTPPLPGKEIELDYRLHFNSHTSAMHSGAEVTGTRRSLKAAGNEAYELKFAGSALSSVAATGQLQPVVTATGGTIHGIIFNREGQSATWNLGFEVSPGGQGPVEIRAFLRAGKDALSETWSDAWNP